MGKAVSGFGWLPLGLFDQFRKLIKKVCGVMGAGRGFRMVLNAEDGMTTMPHPFHRTIIEIDVGDFHVRRQRFRVDRKTMILSSDRNPSSGQIFDRLIPAAMTKLQFCSIPTVGEAEKLVSETNPKDWALANELLQFLVQVLQGAGISGTGGKKHSVRL